MISPHRMKTRQPGKNISFPGCCILFLSHRGDGIVKKLQKREKNGKISRGGVKQNIQLIEKWGKIGKLIDILKYGSKMKL